MIVRDESHIVREALESAAPHIDYWVIVDTGSTDDTREVVRAFMAAKGVPGELHERPWREFGSNRTEALELCAGRGDYAWVVDADDLVVGDFELTGLVADSYLLRYGPEICYWRKQLFRLGLRWRYVGTVHEYPACADPCTEARLEGDYHVESRRLGARSRTRETYARDSQLLIEALERDPDDGRSAFYLGQSLFDAGDHRGALEWYTRRAQMGGWSEEVFHSLLRRAECLVLVGEPWERALEAYLEAWQQRPTRAEPLHEIARHYRIAGKHELGYLFSTRACAISYPDDDLLFVAADVYAWRARDEAAVCAYYVGRVEESFDRCASLLEDGALPESERSRIRGNRDLGAAAVEERAARYPDAVVRRLCRRAKGRARPRITATITSCRRPVLFERTVNSFLNCCEDIDRIGRWICIDNGSASTDLARMQELYPFFEWICTDPDVEGHAGSMSRLCELVESPYWLHLEDDWQFLVRSRYVGRALSVLRDDPRIGQVAFNRNYAETLADGQLVGGSVRWTGRRGERYRVHAFVDPESETWQPYLDGLPAGSRTNAYWPHFTLRPSLMRTRSIKQLGGFESHAPQFEREFAERYQAAGQLTAFFDEIHCLHIGHLTSEAPGEGAPSAYELARDGSTPARRAAATAADRKQGGVIVINLDRRGDRWESFTRCARAAAGAAFVARCRRFSGVDGTSLCATPEVRSLFRDNDFALRRGFVGCALSHIEVWREIAAGQMQRCLVLEDDVELCEGFDRRFGEFDAHLSDAYPNFDLALLGYLPWEPDRDSDDRVSPVATSLRPMRWQRYLGGLFAYMLSARGAQTLLELVERDGVQNGIDRFVMYKGDELIVLECDPAIAASQRALPGNGVDSDIQYDFETLTSGPSHRRAPGTRSPLATLASLAPSAVAGEISLDVAPPWPCSGAAIAGTGTSLRLIARTADGDPHSDNTDVVNYLVTLDSELRVQDVEPLVADACEQAVSYDDIRLIYAEGTWLATAVRRAPDARTSPVLLQLEDAVIVEAIPLDAAVLPGPSLAPFVEKAQLRFVRGWLPTVISTWDRTSRRLRTLRPQPAPDLAGEFGSASSGVAVDGGWLFAVRDAMPGPPAARCHRFVLLDQRHRVAAVSRDFKLIGGEDELCAGLVVVGDMLVMSSGVDALSSVLATVDLGEVLGLLEPCP